MPIITFPDTTQINITVPDHGKVFVDIPDVPTYDFYVNSIKTGTEDTLYFRYANRGTLVRIFVKDQIVIGNHTVIQTFYNDSAVAQDKYRGNLLFYTNKDIRITNTDYVKLQGSFISTEEIYLRSNIDFSGQLLANRLELGDDFKGENFHFVKFDPDTIDVKLDKYGGLRENDSTVIIPIELSDTASIAVFFTFCFDLKDGVTVDDFNIPPTFPICGTDRSIEVSIPMGSKVPSTPIQVNVKKDTLVEPNEYLVLHIDSITGAILPNGETSGELVIHIIDAPIGHVEFDTTKTYKFEENKLGEVDAIKILNGTENTRFHLDSAYTDRYELDSLTGKLTLIGEPLDYEKAITDVVKITLTDTGNVSVTRNIPISVIDVNEAPTIDDVTTNLPENLIHPFMVEKLVAKDPDTKTAFTQNVFTMLEGDTSIFRLDSDGELWAKKTFDYETDQKTYTIKVLVQDKNNPSLKDSAIVTVNITNSNDGPKFDTHDTTFYVDENKPFKDSVKATDQDGDKITYSIVGTVPFKIDSTGVITSTRTFDYEKEKGFTFKVVADDGKAKDTMTVNIKVTDVNEPVHTKDTTFVVDEGKTGEIGKVKGEDEDGTGYGFINNEEIKKENIIALANKIVSAMKKRYSESVEVDKAIKLLKENNYIVEGHWYDTTTGFRRYHEDPDEREARYYNTLVEKFKELKEADEAQDKDRIRQHLETIEIFVRRIGHAISSSDKKGLAKDGLAKMKKYFQDKGQDDLAALVDKYAEEVIRLVW